MSQDVVFGWLLNQRRMGDNSFFTPREIALGSGVTNGGVYRSCRVMINQLYAYGYLDVEKVNFWERRYRAKSKYLLEVVR